MRRPLPTALRRELLLLRMVLMYYSRIPTGTVTYDRDLQRESLRYFPLVGVLVGALGGLVGMLLHLGGMSSATVALLSIATIVLLTGAMHEDGLSDFADGFGGGYTRDRILAIMKDSSTGVYGIMTLIIAIGARVLLAAELPSGRLLPTMIALHGSSRALPMLLSYYTPYARTEQIKSDHLRDRMSRTSLIVAMVGGLLPLLLLPVAVVPALVAVYALIYIWVQRIGMRRIGGHTGDVLGALQQMALIGGLFVVVLYHHYMVLYA